MMSNLIIIYMKKVLEQVVTLMKANKISPAEVARYFGGYFVQKGGHRERFSFEVIYENDKRSWFPLKGVQPKAMIIAGKAVFIDRSAEHLDWFEAGKYCEEQTILGKKCSRGDRHFWLVEVRPRLTQINIQRIRMGFEPICSYEILWTDSEYGNGGAAGIIYFLDNPENLVASGKLNAYFVCPVASLD